jgi:hypothetical protein
VQGIGWGGAEEEWGLGFAALVGLIRMGTSRLLYVVGLDRRLLYYSSNWPLLLGHNFDHWTVEVVVVKSLWTYSSDQDVVVSGGWLHLLAVKFCLFGGQVYI